MQILVIAFALLAVDEPAHPRPAPPDSQFYAAPVHAVDYEAEVVVTRPTNPREQRFRVARSGTWLREERDGSDGEFVTHSDFGSGFSVTYARDHAGRYARLAMRRTASTDSYSRYVRERTEQSDRGLGEECEVWRLVRAGDHGRGEVEVLSCVTRDGIELWHRTQSIRTGTVLGEARTVSLRRRSVPPSEVLPPADLLRWEYWRDLPPEIPLPSSPRRPAAFDLRLANVGGSGGERTRILRRRGDWNYREATTTNGLRGVMLDNRVITLNYSAEADGRPIHLEVYRLPREQVLAADRAGYVRGDPPSSERVLGEPCFWSEHSTLGAVIVTSGSHRECVTEDGLPLRVQSRHRVLIADLTAVALRRRRPPMAAIMPPREAFNWSSWGIRISE